ncbi:MAG: phosphatase PAP2 family protein [Cyclobacteriaceae bacterium]
MFNTDINHFLQKADWKLFYYLMEAVSSLGSVVMMTLMVYILVTGIEFKRGFWVANIFFYTLIFTIFLKETIDFPRPYAVDNTLEVFGAEGGQNLKSALPVGFFETFSDDLLAKYRAVDFGKWGLPSGHTSMITALFFGGAFLLRRRWLYITAISLIFLTMVSRMYLAKHFFGDTLGGLGLGVLMTLIIGFGYRKFGSSDNSLAILTFMPLLFLLFPIAFSAFQTGSFIGFNIAAFLIIKIWGYPKYSSNVVKRSMGVSIFFILGYPLVYVSHRITLSEDRILSTLIFALVMTASLLLSAFLCKKFKLWTFQ